MQYAKVNFREAKRIRLRFLISMISDPNPITENRLDNVIKLHEAGILSKLCKR